jgi:cold shock CspA family protein
MGTPLQISFHNLPHSRVIEAAIHEAAARLEASHDRIVSCRVIVDQPHKHHKEDNPYQVRIDLKVPGAELVVKREPADAGAPGALDGAIHEAFDEMQRQLDAFTSRRRGFVKTHESPPHARVIRLFPEDDYGFLRTPDDREVYFHRNSLVNGEFKHLAAGAEVSFVEELGDKGPQASTVKIVGRHHHV